MKYRKFANTNTKISRLSLGTWSLGGATPGNTSYGNISKKIAKNDYSKIVKDSPEISLGFFLTVIIINVCFLFVPMLLGF